MLWVEAVGGGVGLSDPIQHAHKKSRPKPLCWTRVAMVTSLPLGTRSAGNQLKCVSVRLCVCMCEYVYIYAWSYEKLLRHHYCLGHPWLRIKRMC